MLLHSNVSKHKEELEMDPETSNHGLGVLQVTSNYPLPLFMFLFIECGLLWVISPRRAPWMGRRAREQFRTIKLASMFKRASRTPSRFTNWLSFC